MNYIGREFVSKDGYRCTIIEDLDYDSDKKPSSRNYRVQFDDGFIKKLHFTSLRQGKFFRYYNNLRVGEKFTSSDGFKCTIIEELDVNSDNRSGRRKYKVQFEDGEIRILKGATLQQRIFARYRGKHRNSFVSIDGYEYKIKSVIDRNHAVIVFNNGYQAIETLSRIYQNKVARYKLNRYFGLCSINVSPQSGGFNFNGFVKFKCNCCDFRGIVHRSFIEDHMLDNHLDELKQKSAEEMYKLIKECNNEGY